MNSSERLRFAAAVTLGVALLIGAYSNHFASEFHFDDSHTVVENPHIRDLSQWRRYFTDATTFSVQPLNQAYRPLVTLSLAIDHRLGGGLRPLWFHVSTFVWYLVLLTTAYLMFARLTASRWPALFAAALFGLHPVSAETVNYVIQRGEIYATLGVVSGLWIYIRWPDWRRFGFYLAPVALGALAKPPALIFPALLALYLAVYERGKRSLMRDLIPSLVAVALLGSLLAKMTPAAYRPGGAPARLYIATQLFVAWRYFRSFFLPVDISADTDLEPFATVVDPRAAAGLLFVATLAATAWIAARRREWLPVAFGLGWFGIALLPTSLMPLAEVENSHRMFLPFLGLSLAVSWAAWKLAGPLLEAGWKRRVAIGAACLALAACAWGAWRRNEVWKTEESLWLDVTLKSPRNGRGLMNYGLTQMAKGNSSRALEYYERARTFTPNYWTLEINLAIAKGALRRTEEAERHFQRAISLAPDQSQPYFYYARWLRDQNRTAPPVENAARAVERNASDTAAHALLSELRSGNSPERYLSASLEHFHGKRYQASIIAAKKALELRPDYAEAYNNIAAGYNALEMWDEGIAAAREAVRLKPGWELARNNLAWGESQKKAANRRQAAPAIR